MRAPFHVLFLCTGNSARSILAESILREKAADRFVAHSAGSHPTGRVHPRVLAWLRQRGLPIEGLRSKCWDEFARPGAPALDFVITVCDNAAGEVCPIWPGHPATAHWGYPDPSEVEGSLEEKQAAFRKTMLAIRHRVELFTNLPVAAIDKLAIQQSARDLAKR